MAKTDVFAVKLKKHLKSIRKLKEEIKFYEEKKFLIKLFAHIKIQDDNVRLG